MKTIIIAFFLIMVLALVASDIAQCQVSDVIDVRTFGINRGLRNNGSTALKPVVVATTAGNMVLPRGTIFRFTGTETITRLDAGTDIAQGRILWIYHAAADTMVDGVNLKLAGNFNATADDFIGLVRIDTFWVEIFRSAN